MGLGHNHFKCHNNEIVISMVYFAFIPACASPITSMYLSLSADNMGDNYALCCIVVCHMFIKPSEPWEVGVYERLNKVLVVRTSWSLMLLLILLLSLLGLVYESLVIDLVLRFEQ